MRAMLSSASESGSTIVSCSDKNRNRTIGLLDAVHCGSRRRPTAMRHHALASRKRVIGEKQVLCDDSGSNRLLSSAGASALCALRPKAFAGIGDGSGSARPDEPGRFRSMAVTVVCSGERSGTRPVPCASNGGVPDRGWGSARTNWSEFDLVRRHACIWTRRSMCGLEQTSRTAPGSAERLSLFFFCAGVTITSRSDR